MNGSFSALKGAKELNANYTHRLRTPKKERSRGLGPGPRKRRKCRGNENNRKSDTRCKHYWNRAEGSLSAAEKFSVGFGGEHTASRASLLVIKFTDEHM
jgi:hypothetical protein